jgi:tetratricopeptide (TPR) repeat protein
MTLVFVSNSAVGQEERNPRLAYEIGYNHMGEQYMKLGVCDLVSSGNAQRAVENLNLAEQSFKKAIEVNDACVEAHLNLARLYHLEQDYEKASAEYERVMQLTPEDIGVLMDMALLQIEMDRSDQAARYLERAKRLARDERTVQRLNRFIRKPGRSERNGLKKVNSHSGR